MKKYFYVKYALDFLGALILLLLLWWVIALCMAVIKLDSPKHSTLYIDRRIGKGGRVFKLYKLRTMQARYTGMDGVPKHSLTGPGKVMRKLSLDELPQLFNILNGSMSFVGPRPLLLRYRPYYNKYENRRHEVRPGITGLAQINGRANLNWDKRFAYDVDYVERMSFGLDFGIMLQTLKMVIVCDNVMVTGQDGVTESFDTYRGRQLEATIDADDAEMLSGSAAR